MEVGRPPESNGGRLRDELLASGTDARSSSAASSTPSQLQDAAQQQSDNWGLVRMGLLACVEMPLMLLAAGLLAMHGVPCELAFVGDSTLLLIISIIFCPLLVKAFSVVLRYVERRVLPSSSLSAETGIPWPSGARVALANALSGVQVCDTALGMLVSVLRYRLWDEGVMSTPEGLQLSWRRWNSGGQYSRWMLWWCKTLVVFSFVLACPLHFVRNLIIMVRVAACIWQERCASTDQCPSIAVLLSEFWSSFTRPHRDAHDEPCGFEVNRIIRVTMREWVFPPSDTAYIPCSEVLHSIGSMLYLLAAVLHLRMALLMAGRCPFEMAGLTPTRKVDFTLKLTAVLTCVADFVWLSIGHSRPLPVVILDAMEAYLVYVVFLVTTTMLDVELQGIRHTVDAALSLDGSEGVHAAMGDAEKLIRQSVQTWGRFVTYHLVLLFLSLICHGGALSWDMSSSGDVSVTATSTRWIVFAFALEYLQVVCVADYNQHIEKVRLTTSSEAVFRMISQGRFWFPVFGKPFSWFTLKALVLSQTLLPIKIIIQKLVS
eukprot:TRINITY_DN75311_c0_g1_i1.p1 TRINITY_DN75311_c0_g1~~TRINITY_DN75311_c0_g1_i1.p1  ORF type:complete len:584 (-),score=34.88 TRINITY_DN75311_c0_g1_i1:684-2318(-)